LYRTAEEALEAAGAAGEDGLLLLWTKSGSPDKPAALESSTPSRDTAWAMSQENVDTLRAVYDEWRRGNFRAGGELFDAYTVCVVDPESPEPGRYVGPAEIAGWMRLQLEHLETVTIRAEEFIGAGDSVLVAVHREAIGEKSGTPVEDHHFHVWTFRGPIVTRLEFIAGRAEALEVAGLAE
jgi:ketosteroid isomerase-like protein